MSRSLLFFFTFCISLLSACGPAIVFEKEYVIPDGNWTYSNTLDFTGSITDTLAIYDLFLEVEHSLDYPFENMYIQIHTSFPDGQDLTEQVSLELADHIGIWQGDCGRESCVLTIPIQQQAYFNQAGDYRFLVEQYMRRDPLPGVNSISFRIEDTRARRNQ